MTNLLDWRSRTIEVGSVIVYPTTASSSVTMNEAIVAKIDFVSATRYNLGRRPRIPYTVDNPVLWVRKTRERCYTTSAADQSKLQKLTRVDRVTVVVDPDPTKCNHEGCTADKEHDSPASADYWPAHSYERET